MAATLVQLNNPATDDAAVDTSEPLAKKPRLSTGNGEILQPSLDLRDLSVEVDHFASLLADAID